MGKLKPCTEETLEYHDFVVLRFWNNFITSKPNQVIIILSNIPSFFIKSKSSDFTIDLQI
jgi:very-short-patch-repair endonuclease